MIGVGIVGAGWWAGEHAKAVNNVPNARLVAFSSRSPERIAAFRAQYGGAGELDYHRLFERPDVDAIAIALPHDLHAKVAIEALDAGKHVILEKPMARDRAECAAIAAAARRSRAKFMVGFTHHFIPAVVKTKELIDQGAVGPLVSSFCASTRTWGWQRRDRFYLERALGGGVWMTLAVHFVDRLIWFNGQDVRAVKGVMGQVFHSPTEMQAPDTANVLIEWGDVSDARRPRSGSILMAGYRVGPTWDEMQIVGERGGIRLTDQGLALGVGERWNPIALAEVNPMEVEWEAFVRCIEEDTPSPISLDHALKVMEVVFAAEESAATGREVVSGG